MSGQAINVRFGEWLEEQQHLLGISVPDPRGYDWAYVALSPGTYGKGQLVKDVDTTDLLGNSGVGTATRAQAVNTNELQDTGEFANDHFLRGAIGYITGGGGVGQLFQVLKRVDDNTLEIALIADASGNRVVGKKSGWQTALTTASTYQLWLPGRVELAGVASETQKIRGSVQKAVTVPANEERYGFVLQTGFGYGDVDEDPGDDDSAASPAGSILIPAANGHLTPESATDAFSVGYIPFGMASRQDRLTPVYYEISNKALSLRNINKDKPYSRDDKGNLVL